MVDNLNQTKDVFPLQPLTLLHLEFLKSHREQPLSIQDIVVPGGEGTRLPGSPHIIDPFFHLVFIPVRPFAFGECFPGGTIRLMNEWTPDSGFPVDIIDLPFITEVIYFGTNIVPYLGLEITDGAMIY